MTTGLNAQREDQYPLGNLTIISDRLSGFYFRLLFHFNSDLAVAFINCIGDKAGGLDQRDHLFAGIEHDRFSQTQ